MSSKRMLQTISLRLLPTRMPVLQQGSQASLISKMANISVVVHSPRNHASVRMRQEEETQGLLVRDQDLKEVEAPEKGARADTLTSVISTQTLLLRSISPNLTARLGNLTSSKPSARMARSSL
jgi:hypothetical protein